MTATAQTTAAAAIAAAQPPHDTLAEALVYALAELTVVKAGRTANAGSYSYDYADLGDVVRLTRPVLAAHGLVALTPVHAYGEGPNPWLACTVQIIHTSGERLELGPFPFPHGRDAQSTGSAVTYHRRYALVAALGMAAGDDDDGATATRASNEPVGWGVHEAKAHVLGLAEGDPARAKEAWAAISRTPWTAELLTAAYQEWTNTPPADEPPPAP